MLPNNFIELKIIVGIRFTMIKTLEPYGHF